MTLRIHLIAAARPNFMKVAPLWHLLKATGDFDPMLIHTGQHYDTNMSMRSSLISAFRSPTIISAWDRAAMDAVAGRRRESRRRGRRAVPNFGMA